MPAPSPAAEVRAFPAPDCCDYVASVLPDWSTGVCLYFDDRGRYVGRGVVTRSADDGFELVVEAEGSRDRLARWLAEGWEILSECFPDLIGAMVVGERGAPGEGKAPVMLPLPLTPTCASASSSAVRPQTLRLHPA